MPHRRTSSISVILILLLAASLSACARSSVPDAETPEEGSQAGDEYATWQYKLTIATSFGKSNALEERGTVVFDGTFALDPASETILSDEGTVTVGGTYRCREAASDPPRMLEGTLDGAQRFSVDGLLIPSKDYGLYGVVPLEPLTTDEAPSEYARISIPKVDDRNRVTVSFGREKCTGTEMVPVIAEVISFGEIPFFALEHSPFFIVPLDPETVYIEQVALNHEGSQLLSKAELCIAPAGACP